MKKIISFLITFTLLLTLTALPTKAAVSETEGITALLKELEIMQGNENGDMMLDKKVSRAEFAKIAIAASPQKNSVAVGLKQSPFRDVPFTQWYAPYVKAAVSAGYVVGYLDATFRPENTVTYEEAATIMLRVLGYDDSAFSDAYPYGQLSKAQGLDLLDDVNGEIGEEMSRYQVMHMVYNALKSTVTVSTSTSTTTSSGSSALSSSASMTSGTTSSSSASRTSSTQTTVGTSSLGTILQSHDCSMVKDVDIIATSAQDDTLGNDKVFTSSGTYNKGKYFNDGSVGMTGEIFIKNNKDIIAFVPDSNTAANGYDSYFVYSVLSNASIVGYRNGHFEEIDIPNGATVYKNQQPTTYAMVKDSLEMGDTLYVKRTQNGSVDYVTYDTNNLEGPVTVTGDGWMARVGAKPTSKVFRSGVESTASAVSTNDIVYYSEPLDVVFAYTDKVTGVYEKAAPTKDSPTSVTVSGKDYKIESVEAFNSLSSSGTFKYGDTVTLLLGRTGEVAGVSGTGTASSGTTAAVSSGVTAGFVIEAGKKDFTSADNKVSSSYYVKFVSPDGTVGEYQTANDCKSFVCGTVTVTFKNGKASLSRSKNNTLSGKVSVSRGMIGGEYVADNVKILDTSGTSYDDLPLYKSVYIQRLDGIVLDSRNVNYVSKNSLGEIDELILKDATGDTYTYGIVTKRDSKTGLCTVDINGTQNTYITNLKSSLTGPFRLNMSSSTIKGMQALTSYTSPIAELTQTEALINNQKYLLSDDVVVYRRSAVSTYMKIPLEEAISGSYIMTAYYDKAQSSGGRIRIIIAQDK